MGLHRNAFICPVDLEQWHVQQDQQTAVDGGDWETDGLHLAQKFQ